MISNQAPTRWAHRGTNKTDIIISMVWNLYGEHRSPAPSPSGYGSPLVPFALFPSQGRVPHLAIRGGIALVGVVGGALRVLLFLHLSYLPIHLFHPFIAVSVEFFRRHCLPMYYRLHTVLETALVYQVSFLTDWACCVLAVLCLMS